MRNCRREPVEPFGFFPRSLPSLVNWFDRRSLGRGVEALSIPRRAESHRGARDDQRGRPSHRRRRCHRGWGRQVKEAINPMDDAGCCFPNARQCSATSKRTGYRCRAPALNGKLVCRFHGGRAGAPRGKANGRYRTGSFTAEALAERKWLQDLVREAREFDRLLRR